MQDSNQDSSESVGSVSKSLVRTTKAACLRIDRALGRRLCRQLARFWDSVVFLIWVSFRHLYFRFCFWSSCSEARLIQDAVSPSSSAESPQKCTRWKRRTCGALAIISRSFYDRQSSRTSWRYTSIKVRVNEQTSAAVKSAASLLYLCQTSFSLLIGF